MKSKCAYFWNHLCVTSEKKLLPCCRFDVEALSSHENDSTIENTDLGPDRTLYKGFREQALKGEAISGCKKCYDQEKIGLKSLRLIANEKFEDFKDEFQSTKPGPIRSLELFLGNKCNLKCVMCNPSFSSKWIEDYKLLGMEVNSTSRNQKINNYEELVSGLSHLRELKLLGGEPFLYPNHLELLKSIKKEYRENIKIIYFTNVTVVPGEELKELWREFGSIEINLSIDGVGRLNDFLRFPSKWSLIQNNVKSILSSGQESKNWTINVHATVTNLSAFRLHELVNWFKEQKELFPRSGLENLVMVPMVVPSMLSLTNLTDQARDFLLQYFSEHQDLHFLVSWIKNGELRPFDRELMTYLSSLEKIRGTQLNLILPEFEEFFS